MTLFLFLIIVGSSVLASETSSIQVTVDSVQLEYKVVLQRTTFYLYEPVFAEIWVNNLSDRSVKVAFGIMDNWVIKDQLGRSYSSRLSISYPLRVLKSRDSLGGQTILTHHVLANGHSAFSSVGEYTVQYQVGENLTHPLVIKVVEPQGEEAEALKLYLDAHAKTTGEIILNKTKAEKLELFKEMIEKLQSLASRFPNSIYSEPALTIARRLAWNILNDKKLAYELNSQLMREFPNSDVEAKIDFLRMFYESVDNKPGYRAELDSIIKANANSKLTEKAKKAVRQLESGENE